MIAILRSISDIILGFKLIFSGHDSKTPPRSNQVRDREAFVQKFFEMTDNPKSSMFIMCQRAKFSAPETTFASHADSSFSASISFGPHLHPSCPSQAFDSGPGFKKKKESEAEVCRMALAWMKGVPTFASTNSPSTQLQGMTLLEAISNVCFDTKGLAKDDDTAAALMDARGGVLHNCNCS